MVYLRNQTTRTPSITNQPIRTTPPGTPLFNAPLQGRFVEKYDLKYFENKWRVMQYDIKKWRFTKRQHKKEYRKMHSTTKNINSISIYAYISNNPDCYQIIFVSNTNLFTCIFYPCSCIYYPGLVYTRVFSQHNSKFKNK